MVRTIQDIIDAAGGAPALAKASEHSAKPVRVDAVYKWPRKGIPSWHWPLVIEMAGVTAMDLLAANQALLQSPAPTSPRKRGARRRSIDRVDA